MHLKHLAQLVALSALWGASFIMNRIASPQLGPEVLALFRTLIATATLALLLRVNGMRWPRGHWRELAGLGLLSVAIPFVLFAWAALTLPAGYSALFNSTAALFGLLAAVWLGEDRLTPRKLAGCAVGLVGVGLTVGLGPVAPSVRVV
ncbi:MAG: DMT family transporter, partial [Rhodoferax sp.]|nr:DMT family transporter [Rhodoferax sp.]